MKRSELKQLIREVLTEIKGGDPTWAKNIVEDIWNLVGKSYSSDTYSHANSNVIVYLQGSDVSVIAIEPMTPIDSDENKLLPTTKYYLRLKMSDNTDSDKTFKNLTYDVVKKHIKFYL